MRSCPRVCAGPQKKVICIEDQAQGQNYKAYENLSDIWHSEISEWLYSIFLGTLERQLGKI